MTPSPTHRQFLELEKLLDGRPRPEIAVQYDSWDAWCKTVEAILGIVDLDGREDVDGVSLDSAYSAWEQNFTPEEYAAGRRVE